jgi:peptidoglycan/xylan/chitin deacetylase (PgdA/CDA1 family)
MTRPADVLSSVTQLALRRRAAPGGLVLAYHDVVERDDECYDWAVTADRLASHLRTLRRLGATFVSLDEMLAVSEGSWRGAGVPVAVTFDDALVGVHDLALPLLTALGVPATVFVVADVIGIDPPWWPEARRTMRVDELDAWARAGLDIGAHTASHASLPRLDAAGLERELVTARRRVQDLTGSEVRWLAYPFGHHDDAARDVVDRAGFTGACTFLNGRVTAGVDRYRLPRLCAHPGLSAVHLTYAATRAASSWPDHQLATVTGGDAP